MYSSLFFTKKGKGFLTVFHLFSFKLIVSLCQIQIYSGIYSSLQHPPAYFLCVSCNLWKKTHLLTRVCPIATAIRFSLRFRLCALFYKYLQLLVFTRVEILYKVLDTYLTMFESLKRIFILSKKKFHHKCFSESHTALAQLTRRLKTQEPCHLYF